MSFEKYATDLSSVPATDEQLTTIKKMGGDISEISTFKMAEEIIESMEKKGE